MSISLYVFVGSFIGGGLVTNGGVYAGRSGNAGALGSMPIVVNGKPKQLIQAASLISLERAMATHGGDPSLLQQPDADWAALGRPLKRWLEQAGAAIAQSVVAAAAVVDVQRVVIDGALPRECFGRTRRRRSQRCRVVGSAGADRIRCARGRLGSDARVLGGAMLPVNADYGCDTGVMLKALRG